MTPKPSPENKRPTADEQAKVAYPVVRDRFLASSENGDYAEWLAEVGRYVHNCWLAEERTRVAGLPIDEDASKPLWDECTERELRHLRTEAVQELVAYRQRKVLSNLGGIAKKLALPVASKVVRRVASDMLSGFIGGIGLIVLGLLIALVAPRVVKTLRGTIDDLLPVSTEPHQSANKPQSSLIERPSWQPPAAWEAYQRPRCS